MSGTCSTWQERPPAKTAGLSREAYDADENLRLALIHLVQVIGEAGRRVSREFSDGHPEIPWAEIVGMRHKVVHDYLGVDEDIVWQVVTEDLPKRRQSHTIRPLTIRVRFRLGQVLT